MARRSYRVRFPGGSGEELAGIIDRPHHLEKFPVAVFSHCFTCNKDLKAIVRISRALAEFGIGVLRFDMTGLGGSHGDFSQTSFTTNLADIRSAIRFASGELGQVTALLGLSFGGSASLAIAGGSSAAVMQGTDNLSGATIDAPLNSVVTLAAPSDTQHLALLLASRDRNIEAEGIGTVHIGGRPWTIRREMLNDFRQHDLPGVIARITCPTLLFHSPVDKTVAFDHAIRIMGLIQSSPHGGAPVSLVSLDGADHLLAKHQQDIDLVASTTAAFLLRYAIPD